MAQRHQEAAQRLITEETGDPRHVSGDVIDAIGRGLEAAEERGARRVLAKLAAIYRKSALGSGGPAWSSEEASYANGQDAAYQSVVDEIEMFDVTAVLATIEEED